MDSIYYQVYEEKSGLVIAEGASKSYAEKVCKEKEETTKDEEVFIVRPNPEPGTAYSDLECKTDTLLDFSINGLTLEKKNEFVDFVLNLPKEEIRFHGFDSLNDTEYLLEVIVADLRKSWAYQFNNEEVLNDMGLDEIDFSSYLDNARMASSRLNVAKMMNYKK